VAYTSADIRNIALVGHGGSGKTTLTERLLHKAGVIGTPGSVERGNTVADYDPQEKDLQHSLDSAICSMDLGGVHINLIDTPGFPDFIGRAICVLPAVETAAVVVSATAGVETVTQKIMAKAEQQGLCRMIIVNKIDAPGAKLTTILEELRAHFGGECLPINLPAASGSKVVDCFFNPDEGAASDVSSVEEAHTQIVDQVVEVDEALMEAYLEQGQELSAEQLHDAFEKAMREGHLIPVCFVSALSGDGLNQLLQIITRMMPNPSEGNPPPFMKGEGDKAQPVKVLPDEDGHAIAHVFKVEVDPFVGKLGVFRIHQGKVTPASQLFIGDARKPFKVHHLLKLQGKQHSEVPLGVPGDICAVAKVDDVHFDAVLHDSHDEDNFHLRSVEFPQPMLGLAVETKKRGDEQKLSDALHKLLAEDPCVRVEHSASANETVLYGMGEFHLRVLLARMTDRYHVGVNTHPPSIGYRETITASAEGHHRHKKQTGGAGQFGEVSLRIDPLPRGKGFEFVNRVVGGAIPSQFVPAVEKGVRQVLDEGALAGYRMQDLRVTVHDGKHHSVDSKELAFVAAGRRAFMDAVAKARPIVLEPVVTLEIRAPSSSMGDVAGELSSKRGRIAGNTTLPGDRIVINGEVPLAEVTDFQTRLKSLTGGEGEYTMDFSHYEQVPARVQQALTAAHRPANQGDD
jgi:elongation factor G